ncbi:hypothetical protein I302_108696 [Kwoniella bestiolae CBS 10118]|uniref:NADP-dependent oxidoreductase domain-containing protein n=1 Tax=Kwoniella bestiolae CBS 10118 TaxID=1296100 RepID=A0AAJ8KG85_9TREE
MSKVKTITLNDGVKIPILAFGTGTAQAWTDTSSVVGMALQKGYRHFDCAWHYKNAVYTGKALRDSGIPREDIFVTCKIGSFEDDPREFDARKFMDVMLKDFGVGHVDLLLLHADILVGSVTHAWRQMESIKKGGLTRSIGVSNFSARSLEEILRMCEIKPSINQIEFHPYALPTYLPT